MPEQTLQNRYYMFQEDKARWVVSFVDDKGVARILEDAGARTFENKSKEGVKKYWSLTDDAFPKVREFLQDVGYQKYAPRQTAGFSVQPAREPAMPQPAATNPVSAPPASLEKTYSIREICARIDQTIRNAFPGNIWIKGEITKFSPLKPGDKGLYFSLIECQSDDKKTKLEAKIWLNNWFPIKEKFDRKGLEITKGTVIRAYGKLEFYAGGSQISFSILDIDENLAEGEFFKKKFEIEQKLSAMGIHDDNKNLPMPVLPLRLAVFSNRGAEGWNDFITCLRNSDYPFKITLFTVSVQGRDLEPSFLKAFAQLEQIGVSGFDLGIIVRGGGSITDLDWFNNLRLAETIARSPLKFVIGIGHENDRNVLDEIAYREKTPTAVAEMLIRKLDNISSFLSSSSETLRTQATFRMQALTDALNALASACSNAIQKKRGDEKQQIEQLRSDLKHAVQSRILEAKHEQLDAIIQIQNAVQRNYSDLQRDLEKLVMLLSQGGKRITEENRFTLQTLTRQLQTVSQARIDKDHQNLCHDAERISERVKVQLSRAETDLQTLGEKVELLSPAKLFERGFAAVSVNHEPLTSVEAANTGDRITIRLIDGKLGATVNLIERIPNPK